MIRNAGVYRSTVSSLDLIDVYMVYIVEHIPVSRLTDGLLAAGC